MSKGKPYFWQGLLNIHNYLKKTNEDPHSTLNFKLPTAYCNFYPFPLRYSCCVSREMMGCNWRRRCTLVLWKNTFAPWSTVASDVCCLLLKASIKGLLLLFKMQFFYWAGGKLNHKGSVAICTAWILQPPAWTQGPGSEVSSAVLQWACSSFNALIESSSSVEGSVFPLKNHISVEIHNSDSF